MKSTELQIAHSALKTLPRYKEKDFEQWFNSSHTTLAHQESSKKAFAVIEYDFNRNETVIFSSPYVQFNEAVNKHLASNNQDEPWGLINDNMIALKLSDRPNSRSGRLLLFRIDFIDSLLKRLFPRETITPKELRTLLQTLSGLTIKQSADMDSQSTETKKSHLKSLFNKTELRKQQTLSNFLISHLLLEVAASHSRQQSNAETDQMFFDYVETFMGSYVRATVMQESPDRRFRIIEIGDPAGTPVVCVHHLGLISFSENEIEEIHKKGIRLICPLRHGAIGPMDCSISRSQYLQHTLDGIDLAVSLTLEKKVSIISLLSGCTYVKEYCKTNSIKIDKLILFSASCKPATDTASKSTFKNDLHELALEHEDMLDATVSYLLDKVDKPALLKRVMEESLNNGKADIDSINELFADERQVNAMQHRLRHSRHSIFQDLRTQALTDWKSLMANDTNTQTHFIHGDSDKLIPIGNIQHIVSLDDNYHLHTVKNSGNWIFGKFTEQTFSIVRNILDT